MYEEFLNEAEQDNITVVYRPMRGNIKGLYYDRVIALNKNIDTTAEKNCILAEELGHYYTTAGNILDQKKIQNRKLERRARAWAYKKLVPLDKLIQAFNEGIRSRYELAEHLEVTEKFLEDAINYYRQKYGLYHRIGDYYIYFEPFGIFKSIQDINFFNHRPNVCLFRGEDYESSYIRPRLFRGPGRTRNNRKPNRVCSKIL